MTDNPAPAPAPAAAEVPELLEQAWQQHLHGDDKIAITFSRIDAHLRTLAQPAAPAGLTVTMNGPGDRVAAALPETLAALWELGMGQASITLTGRELEWAVQRLGLEGAGVERAVLHVQSAQAQAGGEVSE